MGSMSLPGGDYGTGSGGNLMETHGSCTYTCNGWPFQMCLMQSQWGGATCIHPYPDNPPRFVNGQKLKYGNYPQCGGVVPGCNRCDDECARREGKRGKDDYYRKPMISERKPIITERKLMITESK